MKNKKTDKRVERKRKAVMIIAVFLALIMVMGCILPFLVH